MTNDPNVTMQQWIHASIEIVRTAFADGANASARDRAAHVCRLLLQMLEPSSIPDAPEAMPVAYPSAQPYRPTSPSFGDFINHLLQNPAELMGMLGQLGPAAPVLLPMLRNALMRPAPAYR